MAISSQTNSTTQYLKKSVTLSSSDIKNMYATPVILIPSPGSNTMILVETILAELVYVAPTYTGGTPTGQLYIQYGNTAHAAGTNITNITSLVNRTSSGIATDWTFQNGTSTISNIRGQGVYASVTTAAYATGNGTINLTIFYSIINTIN